MIFKSGHGTCKRPSAQEGHGLADFLLGTARETQKVQNTCTVFVLWYSLCPLILELAWRYLATSQTFKPQRVLAKCIFWNSAYNFLGTDLKEKSQPEKKIWEVLIMEAKTEAGLCRFRWVKGRVLISFTASFVLKQQDLYLVHWYQECPYQDQ